METKTIFLSSDDYHKLLENLKKGKIELPSLSTTPKPNASAVLTITKPDGSIEEHS